MLSTKNIPWSVHLLFKTKNYRISTVIQNDILSICYLVNSIILLCLHKTHNKLCYEKMDSVSDDYNVVYYKMANFLSDIPTQTTEVPAGATAILRCNSNDNRHNFLFWQFGDNKIIGPGNDYDPAKYKYNVLSGKLQIRSVLPSETGYYRCISKHIDKGDFNIGAVEMLVKARKEAATMQRLEIADDPGDSLEIVKIVCIVISLIVMIACAVVFYRLKKAEKARNARLVMLAEDEDDEGSGDEIYNRTTTSINDSMPGPSHSPAAHITGIDNQGLDTDFNAVFEQISINVANRNTNLI